MRTQRTQSNSEYRNLAIELLEESPSNPRRRFNPESLKELAESFKAQGHSATAGSQGEAGQQRLHRSLLANRIGRAFAKKPSSIGLFQVFALPGPTVLEELNPHTHAAG